MHVKSLTVSLLLSSVPLASAQLNWWAKKAGLKYFGAATDTPGQRERAGHEDKYAQYDAIFANPKEFGQTTPTNGQKWLFTEPEQGVFNWTEGEVVSDLAKKTGKLLRCHTLAWHSQLAPWVEETEWTEETLTEALTNHVTQVAKHWKGRCYAWDVVNEALNEDGTYRESVLYDVLGEEWIKIAFRVAAEIDPQAKLYYNDYNLESPGPKADGAIRIVRMLQDEGLRIDGVGLQAHLVAGASPTLDEQIAVMQAYAATGVEVALTELDIRIQMPVNKTSLAWQKQDYTNAAGACAQVPACVGITLWDFYDPFSWVPDVFEGEGAALLWFEDFKVHPAYKGIISAFKNATRGCGKKNRNKRTARLT